MIIKQEISLKDFDFWGGACGRITDLTDEQIEQLDGMLEELYPEGLSETQLNDILWFDYDIVAEWLDFADWEDLVRHNSGEIIDDLITDEELDHLFGRDVD